MLRDYTQNIDDLEEVAGIDPELLVKTHGDVNSCGCVDCKKTCDVEYMDSCLKKGIVYNRISI